MEGKAEIEGSVTSIITKRVNHIRKCEETFVLQLHFFGCVKSTTKTELDNIENSLLPKIMEGRGTNK